MDESTLFGTDNIADLVLDGFGLFQKAISGFFDGDFFSGDGTYPAVIISNTVNITPSEYTALGFPNYDARSSRAYKKFKVRIINKRHNPHAMLENPCDLSTAQERCQQNALVASHTTVATNRMVGVGIGALVKIKLDKSPSDTYNLQTAHFLEVLQHNDTGAEILSKEACDSMVTMFEHGENYEPPPEIIINSDLFEWVDKYDAEPVPNKQQNARKIREIEATGFEFQNYVKTFIYLVWRRHGYPITITSGVRSQTEQDGLWKKYQLCLAAKTGNCTPAAKKVGHHGPGLAIDINFNTNGKEINGHTGDIKTPRSMGLSYSDANALWEESGIVKVAREVGLKWGGDFNDPIHFQWTPPKWTAKDFAMHANNKAKPPTSTASQGGSVGRTETLSDHDLQVLDEDLDDFPEELRAAANVGHDPEDDKVSNWYGDVINNAPDPSDLNQNGIPDSSEEYTTADPQFWEEHPDYPYAHQ